MQRKSKSRKVMGQRLNLFAWCGQETKYRKENPSYNISKTKFILMLLYAAGNVWIWDYG